MFEWDVFVSHASEDKPDVVLPLVAALRGFGIRVWLDTFELRLGDSIRSGIDRGLANSAYGVLVVSKAFLEKRWPAQELSALFSLELDGRPRILPVWHDVGRSDVASVSPLLSDRVAVSTALGIPYVAKVIAGRVMDPLAPSGAPRLVNRFRELLEDPSTTPGNVALFLAAHRWVIIGALNYAAGEMLDKNQAADFLGWTQGKGGWLPDYVHEVYSITRDTHSWILVAFARVSARFSTELSLEVQSLAVKMAKSMRTLPKCVEYVNGGVIFCLRRQQLAMAKPEVERIEAATHVSIRSYDALLEAAAKRPTFLADHAHLGDISGQRD